MPMVNQGRCPICDGRESAPQSDNWSDVTCKRCLKLRPAPVVPFDDPLVEQWAQTVEPLTLAWIRTLRTDRDAVWMLLTCHERQLEIDLRPRGNIEADDAIRNALFRDIESLASLIRVRLAAGGEQ